MARIDKNRTGLYSKKSLPLILLAGLSFGTSAYSQNKKIVKVYVIKPMVEVYEETYRGFDVVAELQYGEEVDILSEKSEWAYIRYADKYKGWSKLVNFSLTKPPDIVDIYTQREATLQSSNDTRVGIGHRLHDEAPAGHDAVVLGLDSQQHSTSDLFAGFEIVRDVAGYAARHQSDLAFVVSAVGVSNHPQHAHPELWCPRRRVDGIG